MVVAAVWKLCVRRCRIAVLVAGCVQWRTAHRCPPIVDRCYLDPCCCQRSTKPRTGESWSRPLAVGGEEKVAAQLEKGLCKDPRWRLLHAVRGGERGSDIDHVVIGPGGVFTINAKHHPDAKIWVRGDTFMVNGHRQPYIRNSRHEAKRAAGLLSASCGFPVEVAGVVVPVRAADVAVKKAPDDVFVGSRAQVSRWLRRCPEVLRADAIEAIFATATARRSTTW